MTVKKVKVNAGARKYSVRKRPWDEWHYDEVVGEFKNDTDIIYDDSDIVYDWLNRKYYKIASPYKGYLRSDIVEGVSS